MTSTICRFAWGLGQGFLPKEWEIENLQLSLEVLVPRAALLTQVLGLRIME